MAVTKRKITEENLDRFVCSANDVIYFKFILTPEELDDDVTEPFRPEYTHQFFGESENIFGYIGLRINMVYSSCRLIPFCSITSRERVKASKTGGVEADDVFKIICDKQELEPTRDVDVFTASLNKESSFKPLGELISSFSIMCETEETFCLYKADCTTPEFQEYHERMQTLILWFIDAASYIDDEDERWDYFILHHHLKKDGQDYYPFIGYATVYRYYAYPLNVRPRISQMLILPPYQKRGLGSKLLEKINEHYMADSEVLDITVEDPSEEFVRIRDLMDCKRCESLASFAKEKLENGFGAEMVEEAQAKLKINKKQARRVYEILRLKNTDVDNPEEYKAYRLDVKKRLNIPFQREKLDTEKLLKSLSPEEIKAATNPMMREQQIEQLEHMYNELEEKYKHTIERMREK